MSSANTSPVSFKNMSVLIVKFAAFNNLSATFEDSIRNLFVSPWILTWLQMTRSLSQGSGDVIVLDLFGRVTGDVNGERSGSSGFRFGVSTSCLAPFVFYVAYQDLTWYLISTNLFWSIFVTKSCLSFLLIIVCLPASVLVSLDEPALSLTFWQIKHSSSFKGFGLGRSCKALDDPGLLFDMFVLAWLSRRSYTFSNTFNTPQQIYLCI